MEIWKNTIDLYLEGEIWKKIIDFPDYEVSNLGRIKSFKRKDIKILRQIISKKGYLYINLYKNKKLKFKKIHRLVLETFDFLVNCENFQCNHMDGNKKNNLLNNLEWCNNSENQKHMYKLGFRNNIGINNPNNKLEEWKVKSIYQISNSPIIKQLKITQQEIADIFNIDQTTVSKIKLRKIWKNN